MAISEDERKMLEEEGHFLPTNVSLTKVGFFLLFSLTKLNSF
jgi:hypothetical protein